MGAHVQPDEYGEYTICNVYLDTANDDLIRRSVEKPVFKEKLRVRSYGVASQFTACEQIRIEDFAMLFEIPQMPLSQYADRSVFFFGG